MQCYVVKCYVRYVAVCSRVAVQLNQVSCNFNFHNCILSQYFIRTM